LGNDKFDGFGKAKIALPLLKRKGKLAASSEALTNDPIRSSLRNERALVYGIFTTEKLHF
jgi:hypothetical protein